MELHNLAEKQCKAVSALVLHCYMVSMASVVEEASFVFDCYSLA